jgi:hypothetical protein
MKAPNIRDSLPEKYPRKQAVGPQMDYTDPNLAFPKTKKAKKKKWGK